MTSPDLSSPQSLSQPGSQIDRRLHLASVLFRDFGPQGNVAPYGVTSLWISEVKNLSVLRFLYYLFEAANKLCRAGYPEFSNATIACYVQTETPHELIEFYYQYIMEEAEMILGYTSKNSKLGKTF